MATHSRILAWKIPGTKEPGGLQFMGSQRVGYNSVHTRTHTHTHGRVKGSSLGNSGKTPAAFLTLLVLFFSPWMHRCPKGLNVFFFNIMIILKGKQWMIWTLKTPQEKNFSKAPLWPRKELTSNQSASLGKQVRRKCESSLYSFL